MAMKNPPRRTEIRGQDHMLAYITPDEAGILKALGGAGKPGPMGIPSYYDEGGNVPGGDQTGDDTAEMGGEGDGGRGQDQRDQARIDQARENLSRSIDNRGFFGSIIDDIKSNPVPSALSALGLIAGAPALGMMGGLASLGGYLGGKFGGTNTGPVGPEDGGGPEPSQVQQIVPTFNPIEDMVGSEYVAYGGVGADQLRRQLFPYMNFNQPTQPGVSGLVGQYAGPGMGTGLMTGPFGMSNTQV